MKKSIVLIFITIIISCTKSNQQFDAQGSFEADEVLVSSELTGKITMFKVQEGDTLNSGVLVGLIDAINIQLQKDQINATINSLNKKLSNVEPQIKLLEEQLKVQQTQHHNLLHEKKRIESLVKQDAATGKQLDEINYQIEVLLKQMKVTEQQKFVQQNIVNTQNRSILSEADPLKKRDEQLADQIKKSQIFNPIKGTVLTTYVHENEMTAAGKALYKIADLSVINLRAYITGEQLSQIKLGQPVTVFTDKGRDEYNQYKGSIVWISDKAEFTPKTIQTKDERANLVYAIKVKVKNDGLLKIGMYAEIKF